MKVGFVGRQHELDTLQSLTDKRTASLAVITGRRRIGKSRLIEQFATNNDRYRRVFISALAPQDGVKAASQRRAFAEQLALELNLPPVRDDAWMDLLVHLARATEKGRWIILLDEVSWMAGKDPEFLPKLKVVWDEYLKKNPHLILVLCGSVSSWLEDNILSSTGFVGRVSLHLRLDELPAQHCNAFWGSAARRVSPYEKLKVLSVIGGMPRYLEEVIVKQSAEENIRRLCFRPEGMLFREFDHIFSDLFDRRAEPYRRLVTTLADGHRTMQQVLDQLEKEKGGVVSRYLDDLVLAGFLQRDYTWNVRTAGVSKLSRFRLKDNYLRFYLRYILPNRRKIEGGRLADAPLTALRGWDSVMGLQFENLVLQNRRFIWARCGLSPAEIEVEGPFLQTETRRRRGCQIDYLIQTRHGSLYVCEIKFSRSSISGEVEDEVQRKVERLSLPKHCSVLPVLIHANEVSGSVRYGDYFARVINFTDILKPD
ncbi:MAG: AAA family ATPase [Pseudomonadales bacterium]